MRAIVAPNEDPRSVYQTCINSIQEDSLRKRLNAVDNTIFLAAKEYKEKALIKQLYTLPASNYKKDDIVLGAVTKAELTSVYTDHMVGQNKPARLIYDKLYDSAPLGKCPFCGFAPVRTLDHYLPKAKFPQLSVVPMNLVPSCRDCNSGKGVVTATTEETQSLHPYFDHDHFINEQWLFAEAIRTTPITIRFYVQPPDHWDYISKAKVKNHFLNCDLGSRYKMETTAELASLKNTLSLYGEIGASGIQAELTIRAKGYFQLYKNSWQVAMFQALARSYWYCNSDFS